MSSLLCDKEYAKMNDEDSPLLFRDLLGELVMLRA